MEHLKRRIRAFLIPLLWGVEILSGIPFIVISLMWVLKIPLPEIEGLPVIEHEPLLEFLFAIFATGGIILGPIYLFIKEKKPETQSQQLTQITQKDLMDRLLDQDRGFQITVEPREPAKLAPVAPDAATPTAPAAAAAPRLTGFDTYELEYYPLLRSLPLAGRVDELSQIKTAPQEAIVQIVAIGGRGKSRLAYEAATTAGGAVWHRMTAASDAEEALAALKRHLGLPREADADTTYAALAARPTLLVLDNAEDVPAGDPRRAGYLNLMSRARAAGARVLLTSRVEWKELKPRKVIDLDPLPEDPALRAAQAMNTALEAGASEADLKRIVAGAKGHPRLMEWVLNQIGGEHIGAKTALHDLETLQSQDAQAALDEMVLKTLAQMEREARDGGAAAQALRLWCVFRGSFTLAAAVAIFKSPLPAAQDNLPLTNTPRAAESERGFRGEAPSPAPSRLRETARMERGVGGEVPTPASGSETRQRPGGEASDSAEGEAERLLATLRSWKFVRKLTEDRYALDEIVIQAIEATGQVPDGAAQAHFDHYEAQLGDYDRNNKPENHPAITADLDNVEAALAWGWVAAPKRTVDWVDALRFYLQLSYQYERWRRLTERAIKVAQTQRYQYGEAYALCALGDLDLMEDRYGEARANYQEALVAYRAIPSRLGEAHTLRALGDLDRMEARYGEARANYQAALVAYRAIPDRLGEANTLRGLATLEQAEEKWEPALAYFEQATDIYRKLPDEYSVCIVLTDRIPSLLALGRHDEAISGAIGALNYDVSVGAHQAVKVDMQEIQKLRQQVGATVFDAAWSRVTANQALPAWLVEG